MCSTGTDQQAAATRDQILRHAEELFAHYGFWKTNVGDIAARCGMSPANLYRYYRNKQAIGLAVVARFFEMSETSMGTSVLLPTGTPEDRIRAMIETGAGHLAAALGENPRIVELADFLCSEDEGVALLEQHIAWKRDRIARELKRGMDQGFFRRSDPEETAATILVATKVFWMPSALAQWRDKQTILPELRKVLGLIFEGLRL